MPISSIGPIGVCHKTVRAEKDVRQQCDQIWRNFATQAKFTSLWKISGSLFLIWQIVEPTFGEFVTLLGYFYHCKWPNIEK